MAASAEGSFGGAGTTVRNGDDVEDGGRKYADGEEITP
jgi:hypothetical protein